VFVNYSRVVPRNKPILILCFGEFQLKNHINDGCWGFKFQSIIEILHQEKRLAFACLPFGIRWKDFLFIFG
jgi:hypothetical protein